jgi:hypothetical protein
MPDKQTSTSDRKIRDLPKVIKDGGPILDHVWSVLYTSMSQVSIFLLLTDREVRDFSQAITETKLFPTFCVLY